MRRWVCPSCTGGVNAPERMHHDDVRRFCLACSKGSTRLVRRACPALEKTSARQADRSAARRVEKAEERKREDAARFEACGVDVRLLSEELWRAFPIGRGRPPALRLRRVQSGAVFGRAYFQRCLISIGVGPSATNPQLSCTVLHELAHIYVGAPMLNGRRAPHGLAFNRALRAAAKRAFAVDLPLGSGRGYDLTRRIERVLIDRAAVVLGAAVPS